MASSHTNNDLEEHQKTYGRFMKLVKWSVIAMVVLAVFLYVAINP